MNPNALRRPLSSPLCLVSNESSVPPRSGIRGNEAGTESLPPPPVCARRVLVIDEDGPDRDTLVDLLRAEAYAVCAMSVLDPVLDFVRRASPDLLLVSATRPSGLGIDLCRELRRLDPGHLTPILLFATEACDEETVVAGLQCGADDYLIAPGRMLELKARIRVQLRNLRDREVLRWAREQRSSFRDEALTDALTRLPNRRAIDRALSDALRGSEPTTLMVLDIDHFKAINDTWGHAVGDEVLRAIAATLGLCTRREDLVGRFGGEEFVVILRGPLGDHPDVLGDRYRETVGAIVFPSHLGPKRTTVSVGIAQWDGDCPRPTPEQLLERADEALYEAKRAGRDRVRVSESPSEPGRPAQRSEIPRYSAHVGSTH